MFQLLFYLFFWNRYYQKHKEKSTFNHKLTLNKIGLIHAISSVVLTLLFFITDNYWLLDDIYYVSTSYFLYDIYQLIKSKQSISNYTLIIHHCIAIYSLDWIFYPTWAMAILDLLAMAELSNIPGYFTYYFKKKSNTKKQESITNFMILCQTIVYFSVRVVYFPTILFTYDISKYPIQFHIFLGLLYIMGLIWSWKLIGQSRQIIINKCYNPQLKLN